eukprot:12400120-Karenia_brevis.AAC.1
MDQDLAMRNARASAAVNPILYLGNGVTKEEKVPKKPKKDTRAKGDRKGDDIGRRERRRRRPRRKQDAAPVVATEPSEA